MIIFATTVRTAVMNKINIKIFNANSIFDITFLSNGYIEDNSLANSIKSQIQIIIGTIIGMYKKHVQDFIEISLNNNNCKTNVTQISIKHTIPIKIILRFPILVDILNLV